jgi:phosphate starvation-inducible PhoH-like protein
MKKENDNKLSLLYKPTTINQKLYVKALNNKNDSITVVVGPAGTGKTLLACNSAIQYFKEGKIDKIIITRPVVSVEEDIGFLPGSMVKKMDPWTRPIFDIFEEYYSKTQVTNMVMNGQIEISPLGFMRGRTFKNAFIIADEMQNSSPNQMYMLLTRIGINSRMVVTGDLEQSDKLEHNGLKDWISRYKSSMDFQKNNIMLVELDKTDIQRSELVTQIISLYKKNKDVSVNNKDVSVNNKDVSVNNKDVSVNNKDVSVNNKDVSVNNKNIITPVKYLNYIDNTKDGNNDAALMPRKDLMKKI